MFYCREGAEISDYSTFKTSYRADSLVLRNQQQKHTAKPLAARKKTNYIWIQMIYQEKLTMEFW